MRRFDATIYNYAETLEENAFTSKLKGMAAGAKEFVKQGAQKVKATGQEMVANLNQNPEAAAKARDTQNQINAKGNVYQTTKDNTTAESLFTDYSKKMMEKVHNLYNQLARALDVPGSEIIPKMEELGMTEQVNVLKKLIAEIENFRKQQAVVKPQQEEQPQQQNNPTPVQNQTTQTTQPTQPTQQPQPNTPVQ